MLARIARSVPDIAFASFDSSAVSTTTVSPSFLTRTFGVTGWVSVPSGPFTDTLAAATLISTPLGTGTGSFPTRDMFALRLRYDAEDFAADTARARHPVGHNAARRRHDGDAEAIHHLRNVVRAAVHPQAGPADALDALDHRVAGVVLQRDLDLGLALVRLHHEALDVAFVGQDLRDRALHLGRRDRDRGLADQLRVADARQHVGDRVHHAHERLRLPARLGEAGDLAPHRDLAQLVARKAELAEVAARAAGQGAAVAHADRRAVARQPLELRARRRPILVGRLCVVDDRHQRRALRRELGDQLAALLVAEDGGELRHGGPFSS